MLENEVEKTPEAGKKEAEDEQQSPTPPADKPPEANEANKAAASEETPEPPAAEAPEVSEATTSEPPPAPSEAKAPKKSKAAASEPPPAKAKEVKKTAAIEGIMTSVKNMTVLELADLVKALEAEFGVTAAAPMAATAAASTGTTAPPTEEKTEFNVTLKDIGANKINVIKAVREVTSLGLKESKDLVESAPKAVKEGASKDEAASIKQKLEAAGATAEVT